MIEEISFKNVLSFKDEVTFSFEATDDSTFESSHVVMMPNGTRLLRLGVVYGANASGKSNLLYAIDWLREFMLHEPQNIDSSTGFEPFMLDKDTPELPSEYSMKFWIDGVRYWYQLHVTDKHVLFEKLSFYKTTQPIKIFERKYEDGQLVLNFNPAVQKIGQEELKVVNIYCLPNKSLFAARGNVNIKMEHVDIVREWVLDKFMQIIRPGTKLTGYGEDKINEDADFKKYLLDFMHVADFNITALENGYVERKLTKQVQQKLLEENDMPPELKEMIQTQGVIPKPVVFFEHTVENERGQERYELNMEQQSRGTKRVMGLEAAIYDVVKNNAFLCIDEIESSLHPDLLESILQGFISIYGESQLLVTTHNSGLLDTIDDLIRKDNVWFVEKRKDGSTDLYSLVEFNGLNKIPRFERAYRSGRFGALPNIKD